DAGLHHVVAADLHRRPGAVGEIEVESDIARYRDRLAAGKDEARRDEFLRIDHRRQVVALHPDGRLDVRPSDAVGEHDAGGAQRPALVQRPARGPDLAVAKLYLLEKALDPPAVGPDAARLVEQLH